MNTFGKLFRVTNWGESHGKAIGVIVDGCPPLIELSEADVQKELDKRKPGQSKVTTSREEADKVEILSGVYQGKTTGTPISMIIYNKDVSKSDYSKIKDVYRPGHADFTYDKKYGIRDATGGGRSSARLTAGNVAAGAIAKKILGEKFKTDILAYTKQIKNVEAEVDVKKIKRKDIDSSMVKCPETKSSLKMVALIKKTQKKGDSVGGIIECVVNNVPVGLGEPIFDKLDADLAKAMMSINASMGFEFGNGFSSVKNFGSQQNDKFIIENKKISTKTNNAGGVLGGISTGMPIVFRVAFKPTPTIQKSQITVDNKMREVELMASGRHDPCVVPRAVPVVEAMAALVLVDHFLRFKAQCG